MTPQNFLEKKSPAISSPHVLSSTLKCRLKGPGDPGFPLLMRTFSAVLCKVMHSWILFLNIPFRITSLELGKYIQSDSQPCIHDFTMQNEADKDNEDRHSTQKKSRKKINWAVTGSARCDEWAKNSDDFSLQMKIPAIHFNLKRTKRSTFHPPNPRLSPSLPSNAKCKHMNAKKLKTERIRKENTRKKTTTDYSRKEEVESFNVKNRAFCR